MRNQDPDLLSLDTCAGCGDWFDNLDQGMCAECTHTDTMAALAAEDHGRELTPDDLRRMAAQAPTPG